MTRALFGAVAENVGVGEFPKQASLISRGCCPKPTIPTMDAVTGTIGATLVSTRHADLGENDVLARSGSPYGRVENHPGAWMDPTLQFASDPIGARRRGGAGMSAAVDFLHQAPGSKRAELTDRLVASTSIIEDELNYTRQQVNICVSYLRLIADALLRVPRGIICLLSAAHLHGLISSAPKEIWLATPRTTRIPSISEPPIRFLRSAYMEASTSGLERLSLSGIRAMVTSPTRTVVDLLQFGRLLGGLGVGIQAGRALLRSGGSPAELSEMATIMAAPAGVRRAIRFLELHGRDEE